MKVNDKVKILIGDIHLIGTIINISEYREPSLAYAIDVKEFDDIVFVGEDDLELLEEE